MRPEHLRPATGEAAAPVEGRVLLVEELGASRLVHMDTPLGRLIANVPVEAGELHLADGHGRFTIEPAHVHLFDAETGRSLASLEGTVPASQNAAAA
jgi:ABC-type sugar transport system ATPase subunit